MPRRKMKHPLHCPICHHVCDGKQGLGRHLGQTHNMRDRKHRIHMVMQAIEVPHQETVPATPLVKHSSRARVAKHLLNTALSTEGVNPDEVVEVLLDIIERAPQA